MPRSSSKPAVLQAERLTLRPFVAADAAAVQHLAGVRAVASTTLNIPHPYKNGLAKKWISTHAGHFKKGKSATWAITLHGQLIGAIGLEIQARHDRAELGYWIGQPFWNAGYATEAARHVIHHAFTRLKLNRIEAHHFTRNPASGRVMKKLGMTREGLRKQAVKKFGRYEDVIVYGIVRADWKKIS